MADPYNLYYTVPPNLPTGKMSCKTCMVEMNIGETCRNCYIPPATTTRPPPRRRINPVRKCAACKSNITSRQRIYQGDTCFTCHSKGFAPAVNGDNKEKKHVFKSSHTCTKCGSVFRDLAFSGITLCPKCYTTPMETESALPKAPSRKRAAERSRPTKTEPVIISLPEEPAKPPQAMPPPPEYTPTAGFEFQPPITGYNNGMMTGNTQYPQMYQYPESTGAPMNQQMNNYYPSYQEYQPDYNYYNQQPNYNYNTDYTNGYGFNYQQQQQ